MPRGRAPAGSIAKRRSPAGRPVSDRLPLTGAFKRAGWRTVAVMPGVTQEDWPEGPYYAFDEIQAFDDLGYAGPLFGFDRSII